MHECRARLLGRADRPSRPHPEWAQPLSKMLRAATVSAPVRTADVGGWTDTWFAIRGIVTNVAVEPGVEVSVRSIDLPAEHARIVVDELTLDAIVDLRNPTSAADPFLAMATAMAKPTRPIEIRLRCFVPPASGLGTSAAVSVAVIGAVWAMDDRSVDPVRLAAAAHGVETALGLQSGVQDQLAAACGGTRRYDIRYPTMKTSYVLADDPAALFGDRLLTVYLGQPHSSSEVHRDVIAELEAGGHRAALDDLRVAAMNAATALTRRDLPAFGRAMRNHNDATRRLHGPIVSPLADEVGALADAFGGLGWKVNGAGGQGGTVAVLAGADGDQRAALIAAIAAHPGCELLALRPTRAGCTVHRAADPSGDGVAADHVVDGA